MFFRSIQPRLAALRYTLTLLWETSPRLTSLWGIGLVLQGALPSVSVFLTRWGVNELVGVVEAGIRWATVQPVVLPIGLMAGVLLLREVLQSLVEWVRVAQSEFLQDQINDLLFSKCVELDLSTYESSDYHDLLSRARGNASSRSLALLEGVGLSLQNGITLVSLVAILLTYSPWLPCLLVLGTLPGFSILIYFNRRFHRWWQRNTTERHWLQYYDRRGDSLCL